MDLNHRPLGYEPTGIRNFNNLQDAGGSENACKERSVTVIGQLTDRQALMITCLQWLDDGYPESGRDRTPRSPSVVKRIEFELDRLLASSLQATL